jgi:hypothetical protein
MFVVFKQGVIGFLTISAVVSLIAASVKLSKENSTLGAVSLFLLILTASYIIGGVMQ